ncbi:MAG: helix-turn-helix transcriptional regulator [Holosporaceae bacterium]|nr:helix-turn-helix transcriptional regulator [Holosporaceae bacterium]
MARQSLSPMKDLAFHDTTPQEAGGERVGRKRKDAPMTHLKYLRKRSGYTLETLSEITSISISYLSRLESGSRRLNTDLIRRLSHAFGCEPAELLQEVSHDSHIVAPVEFNRKRRQEVSVRESNMPLYSVMRDNEDSNDLTIKICSPSEWRQRPAELSSKNEVFAIRAESYFRPHFSSSSTLYLESSHNLAPESTVVILNRGKIMIKKIWSVTPTSLQLCDIGDMELLKSGTVSIKDKLTEVERNSLDAIYKVVGYADFDIN